MTPKPLQVVALLLSALAPSAGAQVGAVLAAEADGARARAWFVPDSGLLVTRPGGALVLGDACAPRFDRDGRLIFDRTTDDGHRELTRSSWVLEPDSDTARPARPGERLPPHAAPDSPAAGGAVRICIDPGHGGADPGASGYGYEEKAFNLDMALHLRDWLLADSADTSGGGEWEVLMTRTSDATVSLAARVDMANAWPAERFVSIHCNAFPDPAADGTETYSFQEGTNSADLRDHIQGEMVAAWGLDNRGSKTAGFYVLVYTSMPATLSETGFITSPIDIQPLAELSDPDARERMALAHLLALQAHFGLAPHIPEQPGPAAYCEAKQTSIGCVPAIGWSGSPSLSGPDDFHVAAGLVLGGQFGTFFWGNAAADTPFAGGTLCVLPPLVRTPIQNAGGTLCGGAFDYHFSQAVMAGHGLQPGDEVFGQFWFRDPGFPPPENVGLSDGLQFPLLP
ncbi:MAG: hypothetical protein CMJ84_09055 [Planctomycetes bacterium]|jgi:N-acetylmuramoyl-L-alanine amidase|nr:hypothetical protein [Planctomycetota bacterium]MDP6410610.1 N-acetylmuramoyl-L-alanine amidase [Planctomycetota bacterium]